MTEEHVLVAYDISDDRIRQTVADKLENVPPQAQWSLFEGQIPPRILDRVVKEIASLLNPETDSVRIYRLCAACTRRIAIHGKVTAADGDDEVAVF